MNGPIAQLAALTCYANAFLSGREIPEFFPANSTCQYCERIEFVETVTRPFGEQAQRALASDPDEWIHDLPIREVDGVRLIFGPRNDANISDRMSAGFAGGGRVWTMEVRRDDGRSEFWSSDWNVWNQQAPMRKIWRVSYCLDYTKPSEAHISRNLAVVRKSLRESLAEIEGFAIRHTQGAFTKNFSDALAALDDPSADAVYHDDIALPGQLNDDAASLLSASMQAWVFGGMGSWNDLGFDQPTQTEYENVSDRLFDVVHEAIEAAITSTYLAS